MPNADDIHRLRRARDAALARAYAAETRMRALDDALAAAARRGDREALSRLREEREAAARSAVDARGEAVDMRARAVGHLHDFLERTPQDIVGGLGDRHPFVLLPVRLETKFERTKSGVDLRLRIFPDTISVAAPPAAVSEDERSDAEAYWRARASHRATPGDAALRREYEGAFTAVARRYGAYRASYLIEAARPDDPDVAPGALVFQTPALPKEPPVARADALPDCFVALGWRNAIAMTPVVGKPIPDDLMLAPGETDDARPSRDKDTGDIVMPEGLAWLTDFDAAVEAGMAMRIGLAKPFDTEGFDRLIVVGVRAATPPSEAPALVESLLAKHRHGDGLAIVRAGTPTNNTESSSSGWQPASGDVEALFTIQDAPPDIAVKPGVLGVRDGRRLADLLDLSDTFARRIPNAQATDIAEALAMNRAAAPGTLDDFVGEFLGSLVDRRTAQALHRFFVEWTTGRGRYPALRVGREPYGIVVTSAWQRWSYPEEGVIGHVMGPDIAPRLAALLRAHRPRWEALARRVPHAAQKNGDPFARLISIIGLLASSAEFVSRKAVSDEYVKARVRFAGADAGAITRWFDALRGSRDRSLSSIGFPGATGADTPLLRWIAFLDHTDAWRAPIVDRDPKLPLSEDDPIAAFDGTRNYLHWLVMASRSELVNERFVGADGAAVTRPAALLYVVLRHALLAVLEAGSWDAAREFGSALFEMVDRDPLIANIGAAQHVLRKDYLEVDASRLGLAARPIALVDWALGAARKPGPKPASAQRVAEVHDAIAALADCSTASLERLLAEHLDVCSYRLDAWITALYTQRLETLRANPEGRGFHLGAYGWVENLSPAIELRTTRAHESVPAALRPTDEHALVYDDAGNGGFVHAPSLMHGATAAVLRNAHLSHASASATTPFAVNLSSARMRVATALADGVRNGQPISALLGYQIERGLHERHPGVELDQWIYALRDRFPLVSGQLNEIAEGTRAEVVEARNVIDGLALVGHAAGRAYPYDIASLPTAGAAADAIAAEVERARDALDAVSDLLLSESVHQAVQGNFARTKASLQALTEPEAPPDADVVRTPRSGQVLTFRVGLALDAGAATGWGALSPRAKANPHINHWLASHLPSPGDIHWSVKLGAGAASMQSLAGTGLEPIDVVLMTGEVPGSRSGDLERALIARFRTANAVADDHATVVLPEALPPDATKAVVFDFDASSAGKVSLASLQPMLVQMRQLITRARPANALDFRRNAEIANADPGDPEGTASGHASLIAFSDLTTRIDAALASFVTARNALDAAIVSATTLHEDLDRDPATIADPSWPGVLAGLRAALAPLVLFGIPESVPREGMLPTRPLADALFGQALAVSKLAKERAARAQVLRSTAFVDPLPVAEPARSNELARRNVALRKAYTDAARALFGPAFAIVPLFGLTTGQANEVASARANTVAKDRLQVDAWWHASARVRPRLAEFSWLAATAGWTGNPIPDAEIVQLPYQAGAPWIGGPVGPDLARLEWLSLAIFDGPNLANTLQAGLVIDDWAETVPTARETTGVSFHFNRPNAVAPHAILVAVPPVLRGHWEWDDVVGAVNEALDLAKLRAVEPDQLIGKAPGETAPAGDYFQALPAILWEFSEGRFAHAHLAARVLSTFTAGGSA